MTSRQATSSVHTFLNSPAVINAIMEEYRGRSLSRAGTRNLRARIRQRLSRLSQAARVPTSAHPVRQRPAQPNTAAAATSNPFSSAATAAATGQHPPSASSDNNYRFLNIFDPLSGTISTPQISHIRLQMMLDCVSTELGLFAPRFGHTRLLNGKLHVVCLDRASKDWLVEHIVRMGYQWDETERVSPQRRRQAAGPRLYEWCAFFAAEPPVSKDFVLAVLQRQNGRLNVGRWQIVRFNTIIADAETDDEAVGAGAEGNGHFIVFGMPYKCQLGLLMQNCNVHFGLGVVRLERNLP